MIFQFYLLFSLIAYFHLSMGATSVVEIVRLPKKHVRNMFKVLIFLSGAARASNFQSINSIQGARVRRSSKILRQLKLAIHSH